MQSSDGDIVGWRAEAEGISGVEERTEKIGACNLFLCPRCDRELPATADNRLLPFAQADDIQIEVERDAQFIDHMHIETVRPLVHQQHLNWTKSTAHRI